MSKKMPSREELRKKNARYRNSIARRSFREWRLPSTANPTNENAVYEAAINSDDSVFFNRILNIYKAQIQKIKKGIVE